MKSNLQATTYSDSASNYEGNEKLYDQLERIYGSWQANQLMKRYVEGWSDNVTVY